MNTEWRCLKQEPHHANKMRQVYGHRISGKTNRKFLTDRQGYVSSSYREWPQLLQFIMINSSEQLQLCFLKTIQDANENIKWNKIGFISIHIPFHIQFDTYYLISSILSICIHSMNSEVRFVRCYQVDPSIIYRELQHIFQQEVVEKIVVVLKKNGEGLQSQKKSLRKANSLCNDVCVIQKEITQKIEELQMIQCKNERSDKLTDLAKKYSEGKYLSIISYFQNNSDNESIWMPNEQATANFIYANSLYRRKQYDRAIATYSVEFPEEDLKQRAQRMNNLGACYAHRKQEQQSLRAYTEALKCYVQIPELDSSNLMNNIGILYKSSNMFKTAQEYFLESISERKAKSPQNQTMVYSTYLDLAICQKEQKKYSDSINNLLIALNYCQKSNEDPQKILTEICLVYQLQQLWSEALHYYQKLSALYQKKDLAQGYIFEKVAEIHQKKGNFTHYKSFLKKSYAEYRKEGNERKMSSLSSSIMASQYRYGND